jgi:hypothetical protein
MPALNYPAAKFVSLLYVGKSSNLYTCISRVAVYELCIKVIYCLARSCFYLAARQKEAEIISEILLKAASEPEFRNVLIKNPATVLEQYDVSQEAKMIITRSITDLTQ